jgi:UDPglucose 6-dehydrogenase
MKAGATIKAFDPEAMNNVNALYNGQVQMAKDQYEALVGADALAIVTEWSVFRTPSFQVMRELLKNPIIFDGRNLYDLDNMKDEGFYYQSIGRNTVE